MAIWQLKWEAAFLLLVKTPLPIQRDVARYRSLFVPDLFAGLICLREGMMKSTTLSTLAIVIFFLLVLFFLAAEATVQLATPITVPRGQPTAQTAAITPTAFVGNSTTSLVGTQTIVNGQAVLRYTVQRGEWLRTIAQRHGTTVDAILQLNPAITDPDELQAGQEILIPIK